MARVEAVFSLRDDMSSKLRSLATTAKGTETALRSLRKEVNSLIRRLEVLDRKDVTIKIRTSGVAQTNTQLTAVQRRVNKLDGTTATVRIKTVRDNVSMGGGGGGFVSPEVNPELTIPGTDISSKGAARTIRYFELRSRVIYALLIGSLGALGPLTTAVQSLGLLVTAVGSGFLALGGAAAVAFAVGSKFFSEYASKTKEQMNASERALFDSVERIKKAFDKLVSEEVTRRFGYLSAGFVDMGARILPMLKKPLDEFLTVFERLQKRFEKSFFAPRNASLFRNALKPLPAQFEAIAGAAGNFGRILLGLQVAAGPVVTRLFQDIERYLGRKADYRTSSEGLKKTRDFFTDMRPILNKVADSIGNIFDNLKKIGREGRPVIIPLLDAFDNLVDAIGDTLGAGARDFGMSLVGLINNLADVVEVVGPEILKWLGRLASLVSTVLDAGRSLPGWAKGAGTALVTFLVLRRIVPGLGTFVTLLGRMVKLLMTKGLAGAITKFGTLGNIRIPGMGGTLGDRASRVGVTPVRIVSPVPLPVTMVAAPPGGVVGTGGGGGRGGKGGGAGRAGGLGGLLRKGGAIGSALVGGPIGAGLAVIFGGAELATMISGQGPLGKQATPAMLANSRNLSAMAGQNRGKGIVEDVIANIPATKQSAAGLKTQVMAEIDKLPPEMKSAAAKGAADFIAGLESKNTVATASTQVFLQGARAELASFKTDVANMLRDLETIRAGAANLPPNMGGAQPQVGPPSPPRIRARGGIAMGTQFSLIGERGPEAVIPLTNRARRDQVMREAGMGGEGARGQRPSSPLVQIGSVTVNDGSDMDSFVARLESAVRRGLANVPHANAEAMLA